VDAFDVVLLAPAEIILRKFYQAQAPMIVSKDGVHPNYIINFFIGHVFKKVENGATPINIGAFIAYAGYLKALLDELSELSNGFSDKENDQEMLARYMATRPTDIIVDHQFDAMLTIYGGSSWWVGSNRYKIGEHKHELEILPDKTIHYLPTDSYPCVLHLPANTEGGEILTALGYKPNAGATAGYSDLNHVQYLFRMFGHYWKFIRGVFATVVITVCAIVLFGYLLYRMRFRGTPSSEPPRSPSSWNGVGPTPTIPALLLPSHDYMAQYTAQGLPPLKPHPAGAFLPVGG
jgi:hypothetical protein